MHHRGNMHSKILPVIILLFLHNFVFAQYERPGSSSAQFLKIGVSARAAGMSNAYIALASGADAVYYNPAAIARIEKTAVIFTHNSWFAGISHDFFAITHNFNRWGSFGFSITSFITDEMKVRTPLQPDGTGETFFAGNYRVGISYARSMTDRVKFGGTVSYIKSELYKSYSEEAVAIDIATLYVTNFRDFRFGIRIANFGSNMTYVDEAYPLPINFTFGLSMNVIERPNNKLLGSISVVKPNEGKPLGQVGVEWNFDEMLFLRSGYNLNHSVETYSFGGGVALEVQDLTLSIDYSYSSYRLLGSVHRLSLGIQL